MSTPFRYQSLVSFPLVTLALFVQPLHAEAPKLEAWRALHGLAADGSQDFASPANDGVSNLLKFAFNMAPTAESLSVPNVAILPADDSAGLPRISRDAEGRLVMGFIRREAVTVPGIAYVPQVSEDLKRWVPVDLGSALVNPLGSGWELVTATLPTSQSNRQFTRVGIFRSTYSNDFSAGPGAALLGDAVWAGSALRLTDAVNDQLGAAVLDGVAVSEGQTGFHATFSILIDPMGNEPADGVSFAVGDLGDVAWGENGPATAHNLTVVADTFENGNGLDEAAGMRVMVNGTRIASFENSLAGFLNTGPLLAAVTFIPGDGITVTVGGFPIFTNLPVPGFALRSGDRYGFGARTGGFNELLEVDDVVISPR